MSRRLSVRFGVAIATVAVVVYILAHSDLPGVVSALLSAAAAIVTATILTQLFSRALRDMRLSANRIAEGNLESRITVPNTLELAQTAEAMNAMAAAPIAMVVSLRETSVLIAAAIGSLFLNEPFGPRRIAAAAVIVAGAALMNLAG